MFHKSAAIKLADTNLEKPESAVVGFQTYEDFFVNMRSKNVLN